MLRTAIAALVALLGLLGAPRSAAAQFTSLAAGVDYLARTDPGPNRIRALRVDLCAPGVRIRATASGERGQVTSRWGSASGVAAAINGGFFLSGFRPDGGRAAGAGAEWPDSTDTNYRGAFSFGRGRVAHSDAGAVEALPPWAEEAVNGDATLVSGGAAVNCGGCGGGRAPRTAVGLTADRRTLYLVTVDGRSGSSVGVTIDELAVLMAGFGVDRAMNLDGGGSTTMWLRGRGVVNVPSDGSERTVANHLGVLALGGGRPSYHCPTGYAAVYSGSEFAGGTRIPIEAGTTASGALTFSNAGTEPWSGRTRLAPTPRDTTSPLAAASWLSPGRIGSPDGAVAPGAVGRIAFELAAPATPGTYRLTFSLVEEGVTWFADSWGPADDVFFIEVISGPPPAWRAEIVAVEGLAVGAPIVLEAGAQIEGTVEVRNTGSATWDADNVRIATTGARNRDSVFRTGAWLAANRVASNPGAVAPGGAVVLPFSLRAPPVTGTYEETFGLVAELRAWFADDGGPPDDALRFAIEVIPAGEDAGAAEADAGLPRADAGGGGIPDAGGRARDAGPARPRDDAGDDADRSLRGGCECRATPARRAPASRAPASLGLLALGVILSRSRRAL